jgi:restriction system protein
MLPVLEMAADGKEHTLAEAREMLIPKFNLTEADQAELLPSGRQRRFNNRVAWAKVHLEQARLVDSPKRGVFFITDRGRELLKEKHSLIDLALLDRYEEFRQFRRGKIDDAPGAVTTVAVSTPEETLEAAYQTIRAQLAQDLLAQVKGASPAFFEKLVVEVLLKMGYGSSRAEAGRAIGKAGDEGIDGIISQDHLGLDMIYIQAKRWEGTVGRPEIQKFVGALHGKRARKGVFLTTGTFSSDAKDYVTQIEPKVVLVDGRDLSGYMLDLGIGVTTKETFELKRLDLDFFTEE